MRRSRRKRRGLTILELLISFGVLLVAVMSALSSQLTSMALMDNSRETNIAMNDMQACMESLLLRQTDELPIAGSDFEVNQPIAAYEGLSLRDERIIPTYPGYALGESIPDPLPIVLTMTWRDPRGHERQLQLRSMKTR